MSLSGLSGTAAAMNRNHDQYRSIDSSSQIAHPSTYLIRKRQLPELQSQNHRRYLHQNHHLGELEFYLRSVKPRSCHQTSPISPLSPVDVSSVSPPAAAAFHPNSPPLVPASGSPCFNFATNGALQPADISPEKTMMTRLQELEKQLFDDDDVVPEETDAVSVITNSEWSETMQHLLSQTPPPCLNYLASPSPSSSASSSASLPAPTSPKQSLIDAASAVTEGNPEEALEILSTRVGQVTSARGGSEHRVVAYMAAALRRRLCGERPENELSGAQHSEAMQKLYELSPCFKLALSAANRAILEATADLPEMIHVVDFEGAHHPAAAVQYLNLVYALAARQRGKPVVLKVTSVTVPGNGCDIGGDERLRKLTDRAGVSVELSSVTVETRDLTRDSLGCDSDEALVVNLAFKLNKMPDESVRTDNPRDELLRRVKGLGPRVVVVVEQEMNSNTAPLVTHVGGVCAYYVALFDSLDSVLPREDPDRVQVEEGLVRKITNAVACQGKDRLERCEMFGKWRARMRMAEFELRPPSHNVAESLQTQVNSETRGNMGFTVTEEGGGICFGWMGTTLTVASAWR